MNYDQIKTPAYLYDLSVLESRVDEIKHAFQIDGFDLYFATMANDHERVLKFLASKNVGACVNSLLHLKLAVEAGIPTSRIQFTSSGLSGSVSTELAARRVQVNADSVGQIGILGDSGHKRCGVRINANSLSPSRPFDRMGIACSDLQTTLKRATDCDVVVEGLHVYLGTNILDYRSLVPALQNLFDLATVVPHIQYVNIGGGIGVDYQGDSKFDIVGYGGAIAELFDKAQTAIKRKLRLIVEPGRGVAHNCARFATRVTDTKTLNGVRYVGVDASIANFPRPFHHPESPHRISLLRLSDSVETAEHLVVGCTTFSKDILGSARLPTDIRIGDMLVISDAGAYSQSMMTRFLGQPTPEEYFDIEAIWHLGVAGVS